MTPTTFDFDQMRLDLARLLKAQGLSQRSGALAAGVAQSILSRFLAGTRPTIDASTIAKLRSAGLLPENLPHKADAQPEADPAGPTLGTAHPPAPRNVSGDPAAAWRHIPLDRLRPSPGNPRKTFDQDALAELAESIAAHGLLQNLVVSPIAGARMPGGMRVYQIVNGERRWRALTLLAEAGRLPADHPVPCQVRDTFDDADHLALALLENLQREAVDPLEEADAFRQLVAWGWSTEQIAGKLHRSRRHVQLRLALDRLAEPAKKALRAGTIGLAHARVLATVGPERQKQGLAELTGTGYSNVKTADQLRKHLLRDYVAVDKALLPPPPDWTSEKGGVVDVDGTPMFESRQAFVAWQQEAAARRRQVLGDEWAWLDVVPLWNWKRDGATWNHAPPTYQWQGEENGQRTPVISDDRSVAGAVIAFDDHSGEVEVIEGVLRAPEAPAEDGDDDTPTPLSAHSAADRGLSERRAHFGQGLRAAMLADPGLIRQLLVYNAFNLSGPGPVMNCEGQLARAELDAVGAGALAALVDQEGDGWSGDVETVWAAITALPDYALTTLADRMLADAFVLRSWGQHADPARDPICRAIADAHGLALDPGDTPAEAAE